MEKQDFQFASGMENGSRDVFSSDLSCIRAAIFRDLEMADLTLLPVHLWDDMPFNGFQMYFQHAEHKHVTEESVLFF